jgi:phage terminase small subunit
MRKSGKNMPARKPKGLNRGHETAENNEKRAGIEESLTPKRELPIDAPARLKDLDVASATWRRAIRTYNELEAVIVTRLDMDQLIDYCLLMQQAHEMSTMRQAAMRNWEAVNEHWKEIIADKNGEEILEAAEKLQSIQEGIVKLDARIERKMAILKAYRESLYLTPRARAATAPSKKEKEEAPDPLDMLLNDVTDYVNNDKGNGK